MAHFSRNEDVHEATDDDKFALDNENNEALNGQRYNTRLRRCDRESVFAQLLLLALRMTLKGMITDG